MADFRNIFVHEYPYQYYTRPLIDYSLVSSLYGPGATIGWLLTAAACFCSWCFDPQKRRSGAIDPEFIAVLTFPVVAAAHLMAQMNRFSAFADTSHTQIPEHLARMLAIEASLSVTETFTGISAFLLVMSVYSRCLWRSLLLVAVGLLCFVAETHAYFSAAMSGIEEMNLSRLFLVSFPKLLVAADLVLFVLAPICGGAFLIERRQGGRCQRDSRWAREPSLVHRIASSLITWSVVAAFCAWLYASAFPIVSYGITVGPASRFASISLRPLRALLRIFTNIIPRTGTSIWELDQAVAVLAGATVLAFNVYNVVAPRCRRWRAKAQARRKREAYELERLDRIRTGGAR